MARILIAGCGYVGTALGLELSESGHEVFGLRRRSVRDLPEAIRPVMADLCAPATLALAIPDPIDACVYCAAAGGGDERAYRAAYVDGLRHAIAAVRGRGARRLIFTSSTGVYGQDDGSWVDEDSPAEPANATQRILLEGEHLVAESGLEGTVVRLAGLYGPGRDRLVQSVCDGTARRPREPEYTNRIHRDDAAGFLAHLLELEVPERAYIAADDDPAERGAVLSWIARELGRPEPARGLDAPRGRSKRCRNVLMCASGYKLRYPTFREGYRDLVAVVRG